MRTKMLKIVFILLFNSLNSFAQMPVTDVATNANLAKVNVSMATQIMKATSQIKVAMDQYNTYKKEIDKLKQIASVIQQGKLALTVINNFGEIKNNISSISNKLSKVDPKHRMVWSNNLDNLVAEIGVMTETSTVVLRKNSLAMDDSQRLSSLLELYKLSNELKTRVAAFDRKLNAMM